MSSRKIYTNFNGGVNDSDATEDIRPDQLSDASNITLEDTGAIKTRDGTSQHGDTIGSNTGILGLHSYHKYSTTVDYDLCAYADDTYVLSGSAWSALSVGNTSNLATDYVDAFDSVYIFNGTDTVSSYDGSSITTHGDIPEGPIAAFHENRLIVADGDELHFSDLSSSTFQSTSYVSVEDEITGLLSAGYYLYIFTRDRMFRMAQFTLYDGIVAGPEVLEEMPCRIGTVAHRSLAKIGSLIYLLHHSGVYATDGITKTLISGDCKTAFAELNPTYYENASGVAFNNKYYLSVRKTDDDYNQKIFVFDTTKMRQDNEGNIVPCYYPYDYSSLYPRVLATMTTSTGEERLYFGDESTGKTYRMETGTSDDGSAISAYAEKPVLNDVASDLRKRLMSVFMRFSDLGNYEMTVGWRGSNYASYSEQTIDLSPTGLIRGEFIRGEAIRGTENTKELFVSPHSRSRYFFIKLKNDDLDEPFKVESIGCKYRLIGKYSNRGSG